MRACKHCGAPLKVVDTRRATIDAPEGRALVNARPHSTIWRRRECLNGHRFDTIEVPIGPTLRYRVHPEWPVSRKEGTK